MNQLQFFMKATLHVNCLSLSSVFGGSDDSAFLLTRETRMARLVSNLQRGVVAEMTRCGQEAIRTIKETE